MSMYMEPGHQNNDLSEGVALQKIFGEKMPPSVQPNRIPVTTLGAAGAVEPLFLFFSINHGILFPNLRFETPMKELSIAPFPKVMRGIEVRNILSNSFGFGGNNSTLILFQNKLILLKNEHFYDATVYHRIRNHLSSKDLDNNHFLEEVTAVETNYFRSQDPELQGIHRRRYGQEDEQDHQDGCGCGKDMSGRCGMYFADAIITGTGLGCIEDTEKFLTEHDPEQREFLTPLLSFSLRTILSVHRSP